MLNLHIGMPKTGTTTLQANLFPKHSELDYLGAYIGPRTEHYQTCRDVEVFEFMNELLWKNFRNPNISRCKELYAKFAVNASSAGRVLLWSWESLMENTHDVQRIRAENIRNVVGETNITVCLRHPLSLVESLYVQLLKRDNIGGYAKFGRKHRFQSVEEWIEEGWDQDGHPPTAQLEYAESLKVFADVFGQESITVLLFEQLVENQDQYIRNFCNAIGIDPEEGVRLAKGQRMNERWGQNQMDRLRALNDSPLRALQFRFSNKKKRAGLLDTKNMNAAESSQKVLVKIPEEWGKRIEDKTRIGNRIIQLQWGVPLDKYGYPV